MRQVKTLSFAELIVETENIGKDLLITVRGGTRPHIGCCVLAQPRPSLAGDGKVSATSSVLNVVGHVCTGGFHVDNMTGAQIEELLAAVKELEI